MEDNNFDGAYVFKTDEVTGELELLCFDKAQTEQVMHIKVLADGEEMIVPKQAVIECYEEDEYVVIAEWDDGVVI